MRILLVGGGGREHALGSKLMLDDPALDLHSAPGNPGLGELGTCHDVGAGDVAGLAALAERLAPDLVLVGPEEPLTKGLTDRLQAKGIVVFGPDRYGAQLEASKAFAKEVMAQAAVPTGRYQWFETAHQAEAGLADWPQQLVVKADGLAAGKGVVVCHSHGQACAALENLAALGQPVLLEELLEGPELSLFALVRGEQVVPLTTAQDHKRLGEGDTGPNTGGMGAYSPGLLPEGLDEAALLDLSVRPVAQALAARGKPFTGVLFAGLMLTADGPKVLEYNVRFGDPECQVLLARLASPLVPLLQALLAGRPCQPQWDEAAALAVVLAAQGYPNSYDKGDPIHRPDMVPPNSQLIHAGTRWADGQLQTNGGRVMNAVGKGQRLHDARAAAYVLAEQVTWRGRFYRKDIGWRTP